MPAGTPAFHTVTDPEQARLLTDAAVFDMFEPFLARDRTASQAASETGRDLNSVLYRLRQLVAAGLVHVVQELKRAGRPIKVYRSVHDAYFVPYEVTPFASVEERMLKQLMPHLEERVRVQTRRVRELGASGQVLYRDEAGEVWTESAADASQRLDWLDRRRGIGIDYISGLELTDNEAWELQTQLFELLLRFGRAERGGTVGGVGAAGPAGKKQYSFSVAFFPSER